jgi:hypothetical protein
MRNLLGISPVIGPFGSNLKVSDYHDEGVPGFRSRSEPQTSAARSEVCDIEEKISGTEGAFFWKPQTKSRPPRRAERIADKLEAVLGRVDACRARLDRVPALLKRFRQSVLAAATSGA